MTTEQAVLKLILSERPLSGIENYQYLQQIWKQEQKSSIKDILRWYNNKDVVPTLEAMQKKNFFFDHEEEIDMLKLGCTLLNLVNICVHIFTDSKTDETFMDADRDLFEEIREHVIGGCSIVFTCKALVDGTVNQKSTTICKSIVGNVVSQFYPYSMCQPMPTVLFTHWVIKSETCKITSRQNKTRSIDNMVISYFQRTGPDCKIESFYTTSRQHKIHCFSVDVFCSL